MPMLKIGLLLFPGCMPAGLFAFADLLLAANRRAGKRHFETVWVALDKGPVECAHGAVLQPHATLARAGCDALLIPGIWAESAQQVAQVLEDNQPLVKAIARLDKRVALWSYCTGVCLAAQTGRLNGRSATVTWWLADAVQQNFPKVKWQFQHTGVFHRDTATASGVNGYLLIAKALIEQKVGAAAYRDITRLMVLPRPETAHPVFQSISPINQSDPLLRKLHLMVENMPAGATTVEQLARALATSPRTLARKVKTGTGNAVANHVRLIKLNQASEKLILTSDTVGQISDALGFSDESSLRRSFKHVTGYTPIEYRQKFKA